MKKVIARILKDARKDCGLSAQQVVEKLNYFGIQLSPVTLFGYENEHSTPNADTFVCLCRIYGVTDYKIFFDDEISEKPKTPYDLLNDAGKAKADEYIKDLSYNPRYTSEKSGSGNLAGDIAGELTDSLIQTTATSTK